MGKHYANLICKRDESPYWYARFKANGRKIHRSLKTTDKRKAQRLANELFVREKNRSDLGRQRTEQTVEDAIQAYFARTSVLPRTRFVYEQQLRDFQRYLTSRKIHLISKLRHDHLEGYRHHLMHERSLKPNTQNNYLKTARTFVKTLDLGINTDLRPIRVPASDIKEIIREEDFFELTTYLSGDALIVATVTYWAGLRLCEVGTLNWEQVDLDKRQIYHVGKGAKWRTSKIRKLGVEPLRCLRDAAGGSGPVCSRPFPMESAAPDFAKRADAWGKSQRKKLVRRLRHTKFADVRPHDFRHSYITRCLECGVPLALVASAVGHSSTWITERYNHASVLHAPFEA